jgi:hypothetical protein
VNVATMMRAIVFAAFMASCGAGSTKLLGRPVHRPIALVVKVAPEVSPEADESRMRLMAYGMLQRLEERGLTGYVPEKGHAAPPPRLELTIKRWDEHDGEGVSPRTAGFLVGGEIGTAILLAHAGDVQIECSVVREGDAAPADRYLFVGETSEAVADQILNRVFTDKERIERPTFRKGPGGT